MCGYRPASIENLGDQFAALQPLMFLKSEMGGDTFSYQFT